MELTSCPRCAQALENAQCPICGEFLIPRCSLCGNTLVFEQVNYGHATILRCGTCSNERDFELISLKEGGQGSL